MYKLYWARNTGAFAPEVLMDLAGAPYEKIAVDWDAKEQHGTAFRKINPMGQIPVLILPDGTLMTESAAMVQHLADRFPEAGLAPPPGSAERAVFDRWLFFLAVNAYGADLRYYYPDRYTRDQGGIAGVKQAAEDELQQLCSLLEEPLTPGPFFAGAEFSALDLYLLMITDWYSPLQDRPVIARLRQGLLDHPVIRATWTRYQKG